MKNHTPLIGHKVKVVEAQNKSLLELEGRVVDETKNLFIIETNKGPKKIIKKQVKLKVEDREIN